MLAKLQAQPNLDKAEVSHPSPQVMQIISDGEDEEHATYHPTPSKPKHPPKPAKSVGNKKEAARKYPEKAHRQRWSSDDNKIIKSNVEDMLTKHVCPTRHEIINRFTYNPNLRSFFVNKSPKQRERCIEKVKTLFNSENLKK